MDRSILPALEPQPMETRALRALVPPGRRKPRSKNLVPLPDPFVRFRNRAGGIETGGWRAGGIVAGEVTRRLISTDNMSSQGSRPIFPLTSCRVYTINGMC